MSHTPEVPDHFVSASVLRQRLGGKSSDRLSERGLDLLIKRGDIPAPIMLGRYRRWRWSAVEAAISRLEKAQS